MGSRLPYIPFPVSGKPGHQVKSCRNVGETSGRAACWDLWWPEKETQRKVYEQQVALKWDSLRLHVSCVVFEVAWGIISLSPRSTVHERIRRLWCRCSHACLGQYQHKFPWLVYGTTCGVRCWSSSAHKCCLRALFGLLVFLKSLMSLSGKVTSAS